MLQNSVVLLFIMCIASSIPAQIKQHGKTTFRDSLDGAFDFSSFLIDANGFIPLPLIITEPAIGGFGGGLAFAFIDRQAPQIDTVHGSVKTIAIPPNITAAGGIYTTNDTWAVGAYHSGTWRKIGTKYRIVGAYANVNLSFYWTPTAREEQEFEFNIKSTPFSGFLMKQFKGTHWSAGMQYLFLKSKLKPKSGDLPDFITDKVINSLVSMPGVIVEFDNRDNIFTPDKGLRLHASMSWSDKVFGSDYNYLKLNIFANAYHSFSPKVVVALRYELQQVFEDPPFYLVPSIGMRGIPVARYQGNIFSVLEGEVRWDFVPRWSVVAFGGTGKAYDAWSDFNDSDYISSAGAGFRYLMARKFKLRMGVDVARGPEEWVYYIVMGSAWKR